MDLKASAVHTRGDTDLEEKVIQNKSKDEEDSNSPTCFNLKMMIRNASAFTNFNEYC